MVPAVYFFGDSAIDAGNNNYLKTSAKADKFPYGVDLNNQTGRFTNGKTLADFIGISFPKMNNTLTLLSFYFKPFYILVIR